MNLVNEDLNLAIFICVEQTTDSGLPTIVPIGTAFITLVFMNSRPIGYVVTAAHVLEGVGDRRFYLRINTDDGFTDLESDREEWFVHDTADVAVTRFRGNDFNLRSVAPEQYIDARYRYHERNPAMLTYSGFRSGSVQPVKRVDVEVGNTVVFPGLFAQSYGKAQNLPIARFGHIARMPGEPMRVRGPGETYKEVVAYLVECQSWGGHSGSPVLWLHPVARMVELDAPPQIPADLRTAGGKMWVQHPDAQVVGFLGLVTGHFDIEQQARTVGDVEITGSITTAINSGIAVVTPAEMVRQLLHREDVVEDRRRSR